MTPSFESSTARLALEICRYTYAVGVKSDDNTANDAAKEQSLEYITDHSTESSTSPDCPLGMLLKGPKSIFGGPTSFACVTSFEDCNVVSYMGTKNEFRAIDFAEFFDLFQSGNVAAIALKGTKVVRQLLESLEDWGRDGEARSVSFDLDGSHIGKSQGVTLEGRVHEGFLKELRAVQEKVIAELRNFKLANGSDRKVLVTGHSQGGAEAALGTRALAAAGFDVEVTYTFAAPRSGTQQFADSIKTPVHRIEFGNDIVPHLPPTLIRKLLEDFVDEHKILLKTLTLLDDIEAAINKLSDFGYVGLGPLCYGELNEQKLHVDMSTAEERLLMDKRLEQLKKNPKTWVDHHHLANYSVLLDWPRA